MAVVDQRDVGVFDLQFFAKAGSRACVGGSEGVYKQMSSSLVYGVYSPVETACQERGKF